MTFPQDLASILRTILPNQLASFLKRKGWRQKDYHNDKFMLFTGNSLYISEAVNIVLPARNDYVDYVARLGDAIRTLSQHFRLDQSEVIRQIIQWDRDIIRIPIGSKNQNDQLLPLNLATETITKYRDFIAFAAFTETNPRRFYSKIGKSGRDFADNCRFGHTFVGSFGITIECPLPLDSDQIPLPEIPQIKPFPRAVMERIATGYLDLNTAVAKEDPGIIVKNHRSGFSGNMCEILSDIYEMMDGRKLKQVITWASELPPQDRLRSISTELTRTSYEILSSASAELQTVDEPEEDKEVTGRITQLRSQVPPLETREFAKATRTIVVSWEMETGTVLNIHIELPLNTYREACDAHKNGRFIKVIGKPLKHGKFWYLTNHHSFQII